MHGRQAKICPFVPSTQARIGQLARFAEITADDVVLDIGCGDGRALLALAETVGCKGVGIDIDPELVEIAACTARAADASSPGVASLLRYEVADMCAPAGRAAFTGNLEEPVGAHGDAVKLQSAMHPADTVVDGHKEPHDEQPMNMDSLPVNKLDELLMANGVTVVLIYLIADALVLLYPCLQAAIDAHISRQQQLPGVRTTDAKTHQPTVRVVTQVYHYDFGGPAGLFATDAESVTGNRVPTRGTHVATPAQALAPEAAAVVDAAGSTADCGDNSEMHTTNNPDANAPAAKNAAWKLLMYTDAVFRSHPAGGKNAATVRKISEHQVTITDSPR